MTIGGLSVLALTVAVMTFCGVMMQHAIQTSVQVFSTCIRHTHKPYRKGKSKCHAWLLLCHMTMGYIDLHVEPTAAYLSELNAIPI